MISTTAFVEIPAQGADCTHWAFSLRTAIQKLPGVKEADILSAAVKV